MASLDTLGNTLSAGTGKILSAVSKSIHTPVTFSADAWVTLDSNLDITITPQSSSSTFLLTCSTIVGSSSQRVYLRFLRDSTDVGSGTASQSRATCNVGSYVGGWESFHTVAGSYQDSPATASAITYHLQAYSNSGSGSIGKSIEDVNNDGNPRGTCTFTVMEIAG